MNRRAVVIAAAVLAVLLGVLTWQSGIGRLLGTGRGDGPVPATSIAASMPAPRTDVLPGACDRQAPAPPLPPTLAPATTDLAGVIAALDSSLADGHKQWIRCFVNDDELLGRTHHGLGRWLRSTLRLRRPSPLTTAFAAAGVRDADDASSVIVVAWAHHLRGQDLPLGDAVARVNALAAEAGGGR